MNIYFIFFFFDVIYYLTVNSNNLSPYSQASIELNMLSRFAVRAAARSQVRGAAIAATQFSGEKDPKFLQFQSTCAIENLYEFKVANVAQVCDWFI